MAQLEELSIKLKADSAEFAAGLEHAKTKLHGFNTALSNYGDNVRRVGDEMSGKLVMAAAAMTAAIGGLALKAVVLSGELEQTKIAFGTMLGSTEAAEAKVKELFDFAKRTPFEIKDVVGGARLLKAYGFEAEQLIPILTAVGNAAAGLGLKGEGVERIVIALGQMRAKGMIAGEEMRQLAQAGIPAWEMLGEILGTTQAKAQQLAEDRKIPNAIEVINELIESIGRRYPNLMEKQAKTLLGLWSNLKDQSTITFMAIGDAIVKAFDLKGRLASFIDEITKITKVLTEEGIGAALDKLFPPDMRDKIGLIAGAIVGALVPAFYSLAVAIVTATGPLIPFAIAGAALALAWQQNLGDIQGTVAKFGSTIQTMADDVDKAANIIGISFEKAAERSEKAAKRSAEEAKRFADANAYYLASQALEMGKTADQVEEKWEPLIIRMAQKIKEWHDILVSAGMVQGPTISDEEISKRREEAQIVKGAEKDKLAENAAIRARIQIGEQLAAGLITEAQAADLLTRAVGRSNEEIRQLIRLGQKDFLDAAQREKDYIQSIKDRANVIIAAFEAEQEATRKANEEAAKTPLAFDKSGGAADKLSDKLANLARSYQRDLADAMEDFIRRSEEMEQEHADRIADIKADFADRIAEFEADFADRQAAAIAQYQDRILAENEKFNDARLKAETDLHDKLVAEAARYREAQDAAEERYYTRLGEIEQRYGDTISETIEDTRARITDLRKAQSDKELALAQTYADKAKDAREKELEEEKKVTAQLNQDIQKRAASLMNWVGLFDEVPEQAKVSGAKLIDNLQKQMSAFEAWQKNLATLRERQAPSGLMEALAGMGPKAGGEIAALATMSGSQWEQFTKLWQQKSAAASSEAEAGAGGLRQAAAGRIAELRSELTRTLDALKAEHETKLIELRRLHVEQLMQLVADHNAKIERLRIDHDNQLAQLEIDHRIALRKLYDAHILTVDNLKRDHVKRLNDLNIDHNKAMEKLRLDHDKAMAGMQRDHDKRLEDMNKDHAKRLADLDRDHARDMNKLLLTHQGKLKDLYDAHDLKMADILLAHGGAIDSMDTTAKTKLPTLVGTWATKLGEIKASADAVTGAIDAMNAALSKVPGTGQIPRVEMSIAGSRLPEGYYTEADLAKFGIADVANENLKAVRAQIVGLFAKYADVAIEDWPKAAREELERLRDLQEQYKRTIENYGGDRWRQYTEEILRLKARVSNMPSFEPEGISAATGGIALRSVLVRAADRGEPEVFAPLSRLPDLLARIGAGNTVNNQHAVTVNMNARAMSPVEVREQTLRAMRLLRYEAA